MVIQSFHLSTLDLYSISAQWIKGDPAEKAFTDELRAPEVILGASFDSKVDIWALGCMVGFAVLLPFYASAYLLITQTFELLTGHLLFSSQGNQTLRAEDDHLAKMMEVTGETFNQELLSASRERNKYFNEEGQYLRHCFFLFNAVAYSRAQANLFVLPVSLALLPRSSIL